MSTRGRVPRVGLLIWYSDTTANNWRVAVYIVYMGLWGDEATSRWLVGESLY